MSKPNPTTFDAANPDKKLVRQVIHQAFGSDDFGVKDIYADAWCLIEMELAGYRALEKHMVDNGLIQEPCPDRWQLTDKGRDVLNGRDY